METIKKKKKKIKKKINALKDEIERLQERETSGTRDFVTHTQFADAQR